jgi:Response regulator containing a CheY-like receiver domain and an HD-GYP domain
VILDESDRPKVLIVDDQPENLAILADMLEDMKIDLFVASSGEEALQRLETNPIDLVLLDIIMPEMDGYTVCETIKTIQNKGYFSCFCIYPL